MTLAEYGQFGGVVILNRKNYVVLKVDPKKSL